MKCPMNCGNDLRENLVHNALSRRTHEYICSDCGQKEALEGLIPRRPKNIEEIFIHVQPHSEEGFEYSIYKNAEAIEDEDPLDGGFFDGTFEEAIDDAVETAKSLIKRYNA